MVVDKNIGITYIPIPMKPNLTSTVFVLIKVK